jgi:hypothetical protein
MNVIEMVVIGIGAQHFAEINAGLRCHGQQEIARLAMPCPILLDENLGSVDELEAG